MRSKESVVILSGGRSPKSKDLFVNIGCGTEDPSTSLRFAQDDMIFLLSMGRRRTPPTKSPRPGSDGGGVSFTEGIPDSRS